MSAQARSAPPPAEPLRAALTLEQCWHAVPGGTATSALRLAAALDDRADVEVRGVAARHRRSPADAFVPAVPVDHLGLPRLALYEAWHRLRRPAVQAATGPVDVVHATGVAVPPRRGAPLVVTVHDLAPVHHPEMFTARGRSFFRRAHELTRRHADLVLCPSEATRADCEANGFAADRLRVVPWGVDVPDRPPTPDEVASARRRHGLPERYVLWVGTIEPRKNLPVLLAALARLRDHDVHLALAGPSGWHEDLAGAVAPVRERTHLLGFVAQHDLAPLYAGATAVCYPSRFEGFGLPVLEAMAQGAPVVTGAGTATEELVAGGAGVAVDPTDPDALAAALDRLLADADAAAALGRAGHERARALPWSRCAEAHVAAYRDVLR